MRLRDELLRSIFACGFERPSPIQQRSIQAVANGRDVIGQAQSGTGKTAAFLVGTLQRLDSVGADAGSGQGGRRQGLANLCQALVLAPTRELAQQIQEVALELGDRVGLRCHACVGGTARREDAEALRRGHTRQGLRSPGQGSPARQRASGLRARRGRRDALGGLQGSDLQYLQAPAPRCAGLPLLCYDATGDA